MDQNVNLQAVIAKVAKLRALAKNNSSANEAQAAAAAADRLIQEYRIAEAQIESESGPKEEGLESKEALSVGKRSVWKERILGALVNNYECMWYISNSYVHENGKASKKISYKVVGRKSDIELVEYMYAWIVGELERLCKANHKGKGLSVALSFYEGAAAGFHKALLDAKEASKVQATSSALVVLEKRKEQARDWIQSNVGRLGKAKSLAGSRAAGSDAWHDGYKAGLTLNAPKGMSGQASSGYALKTG